jgi:hypothetical protein
VALHIDLEAEVLHIVLEEVELGIVQALDGHTDLVGERHIGLEQLVLRTGSVEVELGTVQALELHIGPEGVEPHTDPAERRTVQAVVHHTVLEVEALRTVLEEAAHHIDLVEAVRHTDLVEVERHIDQAQASHTAEVVAAGHSLAAVDSHPEEDTVGSALVVVVDNSLAEEVDRSLEVGELDGISMGSGSEVSCQVLLETMEDMIFWHRMDLVLTALWGRLTIAAWIVVLCHMCC